MKWAERSRSLVPVGGSPNEDTRIVELDDAGLHESGTLDKDALPLRKTKRDIQDIIDGRPGKYSVLSLYCVNGQHFHRTLTQLLMHRQHKLLMRKQYKVIKIVLGISTNMLFTHSICL